MSRRSPRPLRAALRAGASLTCPASALVAFTLLGAASLPAQQATMVYMLGRDTAAIEQYTRAGTTITGEMVQRTGGAVARVRYSLSVGRDGRPTAATISRLNQDGTPVTVGAREIRFAVGADSVIRESVFADSTQRRAFAARGAAIAFPVFVYGPYELLAAWRRMSGGLDSVPAVGMGGAVGFAGFTAVEQNASGSVLRLRGAPYAMVLRFDARDRLLSLDGSNTTNKVMATRSEARVDVAALAAGMKPTGTLSARGTARGAFGPGGMVVVDYGRPMVRERTVWGGTLVPFDSVWRAGANDATHLFTTRALTFGATTVAPGMYTLWVLHTTNGTWLIVNRQTGQWGTQYDAAQDVARVPLEMGRTPEHVEEFTITVRATGPSSGRLELVWADRSAGVNFVTSAR